MTRTNREVYHFFAHLRFGMLDVSIELNNILIMDCPWIAHGWLVDRLTDCLRIAYGLLNALNSPEPWGSCFEFTPPTAE